MTDDKIVQDAARDPEDETTGPVRSRVRAAAKKATQKVAKKAGQKKTIRKTTTAAGKTAKKVAKTATKTEKVTPAKAAAPTPKITPTKAAAAKSKAVSARADAAAPKATTAKTAAPTPKTTPAKAAAAKSKAVSARADAAAPKATAAKTAAAAPKIASASAAAVPGVTAASESVVSTFDAPAASPHEAGPSTEAPRPPAPIHPGASMDAMHEHVGGLGSLLALWGPLIIVGFLVLVFRGGEERGNTVAAGSDALTQAAAGTPAETVRAPQGGGAIEPAFGSRSSERASGPPGVAREVAGTFDGAGNAGGFTMRTSIAGAPAFAGRGPNAAMSAGSPGRSYPSPPGPYRDPRYRGLPTGESWPAAGASEWSRPAEGRDGSGYEDGGDAPVQWVRCAPPYYWCPAPSSPAW